MKKLVFCLVFVLLFPLCVGCSETVEVPLSGAYYAECDSEPHMTPYLWLDTEECTYQLGGGSVISFAYTGEYVSNGATLTAAYADMDEFRFTILDEKTLVLQTPVFSLPSGTKFVYSEDFQ